MKRMIGLSLSVVLAASAIGMTAVAKDDINVIVNGEKVVFEDTAPFIENERTLVPMRAIFEALGAVVEWDEETRTVVSYDPVSKVSIVLQIGSKTMFVNDKSVTLEVPAKIVNERTVVPVRAIAEGMNSKVDWDGSTMTVIVTKDIKNNAQVADPWKEFATLEELNAALGVSDGGIAYSVADPVNPLIEIKSYRYLASENMAEILAIWSVGASADVAIRTQPGDTDISGIYGGEKTGEYLLNDSMVEIYKYQDTVYAVWACEDAGTVYSHSVAVTSSDFDTTEVVKEIVKDVEENHPVG